MLFTLAKFSIRQQILIGYVPVLIVLAMLAISSMMYFTTIDENVDSLKEINRHNLLIKEIKKDILEIQRNVLVYSYIGYQGVLRKITFLHHQLESRINQVDPKLREEPEIGDRLDRMLDHYEKYKTSFTHAIKEKKRIEVLVEITMAPLIDRAQLQLDKLELNVLGKKDFESSYKLRKIKHDLYVANSNIESFNNFPDSELVNETRKLIRSISVDINSLKQAQNSIYLSAQADEFLDVLNQYNSVFKDIIRTSSAYLNRINVVMAGKSAEMDRLSEELDKLIAQRSEALNMLIQRDIDISKKQFILLISIAAVIGVLCSIAIANGISKPVRLMANTLSSLSGGQLSTNIPGQDRRDEVGEMAKAANEFKGMAKNLEEQTAELEEFAYRTSHDLRSPLVSSIALLGVAKKSIQRQTYDKAERSITLVQDALTKLEVLVKDILELTKAKNIEEKDQPINISVVVEESLSKISHMAGFERLKIIQELNFEGIIQSKKSLVILIIENLVSNAVKYQDKKKPDSFIKISTSKQKNMFTLDIEDNGLGFPKDQQKNMFAMFKRFHPKASFGSGLGLYMLSKSVDKLHGTIVFTDTGEGSKFSITFAVN